MKTIRGVVDRPLNIRTFRGKMRILIIVQNYPPERGPVRYTSGLAQGLAARGHDVRVVTGLPHYPEGAPHPEHGRLRPSVRREDGVEVVRVPLVMASNEQRARRVIGMASFAATAVGPALAGAKPDVVIASAPPVPVVGVGIACASAFGWPLVTLLRDVEPQITFELRALADRWWARELIRLSVRAYDRADRLVVVHESQVASLTDHGVDPLKIETIRHGIDLDRFRAESEREIGVEALAPTGRKLVVYAGTLGVAHDVDQLVRAFAAPEVRALPVDLVLVGYGESAAACDRLIRDQQLDNVRRLPPLPLAKIPALLRRADAVVTSYRTTRGKIAGMIGSKLYEYFASERPVIVGGDGVAADLVRQVGNGWVVSPGDSHALAQALRQLIEDPGLVTAMGRRGIEHARKDFSLRCRHDQWEKLLKRVLVGERAHSVSLRGAA